MNCSQFRQFYSDFADGLIDEAEAVAFHIHMAECLACERFDAALRTGGRALRQLRAPTPSWDFDTRLFNRIIDECQHDEPALIQWSGLAGAVMVVAVVSLVGWEARGLLNPPSAATHQASHPNANAVEPFLVRFAGDTSIRYPGKLPIIPVSRDTFRSATRPARSFEITVDWMTP
jgi:anti-sigma factor RsiW